MQKLCDELSTRRKGTSSAAPVAAKPTPNASDDFWGARGGSSLNRATGSSLALSGRRGQERKSQPVNKGKPKGKVYQKAAAEDFWGGGTTSGRSTSEKSASTTAPAPESTPPTTRNTKTKVKTNNNKGNAKLPAMQTKPKTQLGSATKRTQPPATPTTVTSSKPDGKGGNKGGAGLPAGRSMSTTKSAAATGAAAAVATAPTPEWSGVTCQCMGKKHDVVTNCTSCGKIACVVEGGFGCSFCGSTLPATDREPRHKDGDGNSEGVIQRGGGDPRAAADAGVVQSAALKEALARKDKLLLFDRTSASRTRVLDDQGDYFTSHNWLTQREREKGEAEEKARRDEAAQRRGARRQVKVSIDIMGRRVIERQKAGDGAGDEQNKADGDVATTGLSLDFGSDTASTGGGFGGGAVDDPDRDATKTSAAPAGGGGQRPSLENTGLRGRAKEVYDVMRANLDKQARRRHGGGAGEKKGGSVVADKSRVSLWRVQHDVDSDDVLRQDQPSGGSSGGAGSALDGFQKFEPTDELLCASR